VELAGGRPRKSVLRKDRSDYPSRAVDGEAPGSYWKGVTATSLPIEAPAAPAESAYRERISLVPWLGRFAALTLFPIPSGVATVVLLLMAKQGESWELCFWALAATMLPLSVLAAAMTEYFSTEFVVNGDRVVVRSGITSRRITEWTVPKIESVTVDQGFFGMMFDFGNVTIRGTGGSHEVLRNVRLPLSFRDAICSSRSAPQSCSYRITAKYKSVLRQLT